MSEFPVSGPRGDLQFPKNYQGEPTVAVNPLNPLNVVAASNDFYLLPNCTTNLADGTECQYYMRFTGHQMGSQGIYTSLDGGATWTYMFPDWYSTLRQNADSDPQLAFGPRPGQDGKFAWKNGARVYFAAMSVQPLDTDTDDQNESLTLIYSDDGGITWSQPQIFGDFPAFNDFHKLWVDIGEDSPYFGYIYCAAYVFPITGSSFTDGMVRISSSPDGGSTWRDPIRINTGDADTFSIRTDTVGTVFVLTKSDSSLVVATSTNGGLSYSANAVAAITKPLDAVYNSDDAIFPGARFRAGGIATMDVALLTNKAKKAPVFVTWVDYEKDFLLNGVAGELQLIMSDDGGQSWSQSTIPGVMDRSPFFPAIAVRQGASSRSQVEVMIGFLAIDNVARTADPGDVRYDAYVVHSKDGGATWDPPLRVSTVSSDPNASVRMRALLPDGPLANYQFLGDYIGLSATTTGVYFVWPDSRNAVPCPAWNAWNAGQGTRPNIYTQCPRNFGNMDIYGAYIPWGTSPAASTTTVSS